MKAIISHITPIGWIISLIMNNSQKDELTSFYLRQNLGLILSSIAVSMLSFVPLIVILSGIINIGLFVLWVISLINAFGSKMAPIPLLGPLFQDWFKSI